MSNFNPNLTHRLEPTAQDSAAHDIASFRNQRVARQQEFVAEQTILLTPKSTPSFAWLVMIKGKQLGQLFALGKQGTMIGRKATCQIVLREDKAVSAEHAQVDQEGPDFVIHDLASRNKTWVNGQAVYHDLLKENDVITIGETSFVFKQIRDQE